jgi:cardiolipin synthase
LKKQTLFILIALCLLITKYNLIYLKQDTSNEVALYFNNQPMDFLRLHQSLFKKARKSLFLRHYQISHPALIKTLKKIEKQGIKTTLYVDSSSPSIDLQTIPLSVSGLMHEKLLIIDDQEIWLGSTNLTQDSLQLHENNLVGLKWPELAQALKKQKTSIHGHIGKQPISYLSLPDPQAKDTLISILDNAQDHIKVAMYTFTHKQIALALIRAHQRGVEVSIILDPLMSRHTNAHVIQLLQSNGLAPQYFTAIGKLHHKLAWVDNQLIIGSANWTESAFKRNQDHFLIIQDLSKKQNKTLKSFWKKLSTQTKTLSKMP